MVSAYMCDPQTADAEFLLSKAQYKAITGREQKKDADVLCYQLRQAFAPGEIDHDASLKVGHDLAMRWTKGNHAFFVVSHIDRPHPYIHVYYNSTPLTAPVNSATSKVRRGLCGGCLTAYALKMVCLL